MVKQNNEFEIQEDGGYAGSYSGPFMEPIRREMPEGLNLSKKTYTAKWLEFPKTGRSGGWSRYAKHKPQPVLVTVNTTNVSMEGKSVYVDGVRKLKLNLYYSDGTPIREDYYNISFADDKINEGLNLPKKLPYTYAQLMYRDGANDKTWFNVQLTPEVLSQLKFNEDGELIEGQEFSIEDFDISPEDMWELTGGYDDDYDHDLVDVIEVYIDEPDNGDVTLNEGLNLQKKQPLTWHDIHHQLLGFGFDEETLERICDSYDVPVVEHESGNGIDFNFTLEDLTDYFLDNQDRFYEFINFPDPMNEGLNLQKQKPEDKVTIYDAENNKPLMNDIPTSVLYKLVDDDVVWYDPSIKKWVTSSNYGTLLHNILVYENVLQEGLESEMDEGTDIASVGAGGHGSGFAYIDPNGKGYHKDKNWGTWAKNEKSMRFNQKPMYDGGSFVTVKKKCQKFPYCNQGDTGALNFSNPKAGKSKTMSEGINSNVKIIRINGYDYFYDQISGKLFADDRLKNEINVSKQFTPNELYQYHDQLRFKRSDLNEGLNLPKKPIRKYKCVKTFSLPGSGIFCKKGDIGYFEDELAKEDITITIISGYAPDMEITFDDMNQFLEYWSPIGNNNANLNENNNIYNKTKIMGTAQRLKEYEDKLFKGLVKELILDPLGNDTRPEDDPIGDENDLSADLSGNEGYMDEYGQLGNDQTIIDNDPHSIALELKDRLPVFPTEEEIFDGLCDIGYCGKDSGLIFNQVMSELMNMDVDINLSEGKKKWIQKATKDIEERGTEGKCTPITKPGCTGKAKTLAKTFKKIGKEKETKEGLNLPKKKKMKKLKESGTPGIDMYNKIRGESGTSNQSGVKHSMDNAKRLNQVADKTENEKLSGIGKGEPKWANFDEKQTESNEEYTNMLRGMGLQDIQYDTQPSESFRQRAEDAIKGTVKMGNSPDWANAQRDFDGTKGELGQKIVDGAKKKAEMFNKGNKEEKTSIRFKYPTKDHEDTHIAVNENKLQNLKTKRVIYFEKDIDNLIPESHKIEGAEFKLFDGNKTVYDLKWERGALVVESEKNKNLVESERNLFKKMTGYSVGEYKVKPKGYLTEEETKK